MKTSKMEMECLEIETDMDHIPSSSEGRFAR